jgi:hypothetical protein
MVEVQVCQDPPCYAGLRTPFLIEEIMMKPCLIIAAVALLPVCAHAQAAKPCEELKAEIAARLDAKGVQSYSLDIVAKEQDAEGKVVGTCDGGTKKIVYRRATTPPQASANAIAKP